MSQSARLTVSRRQRGTPYTPRVDELGVTDYSIVNHMILPKGFGYGVEDDYWHLKEHVQLWDVSCQRQVSLKGEDAACLAQLMTPRDLSKAEVGQCLYAPVIDNTAAMLNDPVILKLAEDHYWFSIADSDLLLWAKGLSVGYDLNVTVDEPDVSPLAIQGPKSDELVARVFGDKVRDIKFFRFATLDFKDHPLVVARSGYSRQGGFEIYLDDSSLGLALWDALWSAGQDLNVRPGSPNLIERVEGGLLSYGNEMTRDNNPYECTLGKYCDAPGNTNFVGKEALQRIAERGPEREIRGVVFDGEKCPSVAAPWDLTVDGEWAGVVSTAIWSPRLEKNVALAMLERSYREVGQDVVVHLPGSIKASGKVSGLPI